MRSLSMLFLLFLVVPSSAEDWMPLFNGQNLEGWQDRNGQDSKWLVKEGALVRVKGAGDIWTKQTFGDFVLELEFQTQGNSGVFIRTADPKNNVQTGIEVQVDVPRGKPNKHSVGAIYDLVTPRKENARKEGWNKLTITAQNNQLTVEMNGEKINSMNLDEWTDAGKNPDGSKNKFKTALKAFKRVGHIGFQDHGADVMYRNIKIKKLN